MNTLLYTLLIVIAIAVVCLIRSIRKETETCYLLPGDWEFDSRKEVEIQ